MGGRVSAEVETRREGLATAGQEAAVSPPSVQPGPDRLEQAVKRILHDPNFPGCSENIRSLLAMAASPDTTAKAMTAIVLRDVSLTLQVLRTANSAYFNRSDQPILNVSHAVTMMGVERVVKIASGLKFLEHFAMRSPGIRELVLLSLLTGSQARSVAERADYPRPEEAYLCGLLRNLGELLVSYYDPTNYAQVVVAMMEEGLTERQACRKILSFFYEDLAAQVLQQWNLGPKVLVGIRGEAEPAPRGLMNEQNLLSLITSFSHQLTRVVHRGDPDRVRGQMRRLLERYGPALRLDEKWIQSMMSDAVADVQDVFRSFGLKVDGLRLRGQVLAALDVLEEARQPAAESAVSGSSSPLDRAAVRLRAVLREGSDFDLNEFLGSALEAVVESGCFQRAVFALLNERKTALAAKVGRGQDADRLLEQFRLPVSSRVAPLAGAILQRKDFWVDRERDNRFEDSPLVALANPRAFAVLPVVVDQLAIGCLYLDRQAAGARLSEADMQKIGEFRELVAAAVDRKRSRRPAEEAETPPVAV